MAPEVQKVELSTKMCTPDKQEQSLSPNYRTVQMKHYLEHTDMDLAVHTQKFPFEFFEWHLNQGRERDTIK